MAGALKWSKSRWTCWPWRPLSYLAVSGEALRCSSLRGKIQKLSFCGNFLVTGNRLSLWPLIQRCRFMKCLLITVVKIVVFSQTSFTMLITTTGVSGCNHTWGPVSGDMYGGKGHNLLWFRWKSSFAMNSSHCVRLENPPFFFFTAIMKKSKVQPVQ